MDPLQFYIHSWGGHWPILLGFGVAVGLAALAWTLFWKGMALWKAARNREMGWFFALLIINTMGILEILYIYFFSKNKSRGFPKLD